MFLTKCAPNMDLGGLSRCKKYAAAKGEEGRSCLRQCCSPPLFLIKAQKQEEIKNY